MHISYVGQALSRNVCAAQGDLGKRTWCFKAGIRLHFRTVQGLAFEEARRALSSLNGLFVISKEG